MTQVWAKPIGGAKMAVFVINNDAKGEHAVAISFDDLDLEFRGRARVRCVWGKKDLGEFSASYQTDSIGPHDSRLLVLSSARAFECRAGCDGFQAAATRRPAGSCRPQK